MVEVRPLDCIYDLDLWLDKSRTDLGDSCYGVFLRMTLVGEVDL